MQNSYKKTAFTLAEIMIALFISAIIAMIFLKAIRNGTNHYMNNLMSYSALNNLSTAAYDMAQSGCMSSGGTSNDLTSAATTFTPALTPPHPYCDAATGLLPRWRHTDSTTVTSPVNIPNRGFCDRFAREEINVTGAIDCTQTASDSTNFTTATPNFISTSGARFFNFGSPLSGQTAATSTDYYTVYIDIDGKKRNGRMTESVPGSSNDVDVIKFYVAINSDTSVRPFQVIPDPDSIASNRTEYLTASVKYLNAGGTAYVYVLTGVDYRTAMCGADPTAPQKIISDYCTATHTYGVRTQNAACTSGSGNNPCIFELDEPGMLGVRNIFNADNK